MKFLLIGLLALTSLSVFSQTVTDGRDPFECAKRALSKAIQERNFQWSMLSISKDHFYVNGHKNLKKNKDTYIDELTKENFNRVLNWEGLDGGYAIFNTNVNFIEKNWKTYKGQGTVSLYFMVNRDQFTEEPTSLSCSVKYIKIDNSVTDDNIMYFY